jgi:hypothetical protein
MTRPADRNLGNSSFMKKFTESYQIDCLLEVLKDDPELSGPVVTEARDRPDFLLTTPTM